jgi:5-methylcytosine-specific restriction endonuclease McrA
MELIINKQNAGKCYVEEYPIEDLPWHYFKRLKNTVPKDKKIEIDHILAISKGGESLGQENHRILCIVCHKIKTKSDLSGKRPKRI